MKMPFVPGLRPLDRNDHPSLWFVFHKNRLLVHSRNGAPAVPDAEMLATHSIRPERSIYLGTLGGRACFAVELPSPDTRPGPCAWMNLLFLLDQLTEELFWVAGLANHLLDWDRSHRHCGGCGHPTQDKGDERAKYCPACGLVNFPRLSPAVIVAVIRDDRILLARNKRFNRPFYSVLAGFVEPGESLEACVQREIHEEVGIAVKNIRYFGSQPWPFPNSLMVGFVADYAGGEILVDNTELIEAGWFSTRSLPEIPSRVSIARQLIDWFVNNRS